jgi:hypothetical protein
MKATRRRDFGKLHVIDTLGDRSALRGVESL